MVALTLKRDFGIRPLDYALVGRWAIHACRGQAVHRPITATPPVAYEAMVGWGLHYLIGVMFAVVFGQELARQLVRRPRQPGLSLDQCQRHAQGLSFNASLNQCASYPLSASIQSAFGRCARRAAAPLQSLTCPADMENWIGRPFASVPACSLVVIPPLVHPIWRPRPLFHPKVRCRAVRLQIRRVDHDRLLLGAPDGFSAQSGGGGKVNRAGRRFADGPSGRRSSGTGHGRAR